MNTFKYTFNEKRYHTFNYYLKSKYKSKVAKIILDAGFTCPNRDGSKALGGCIFCSEKGSGDSNLFSSDDILKQYENNKMVMKQKWDVDKFIPYFQAFSNTYGPLEKIKAMLEPFINKQEVVEIAIATRCDCLKQDVIDYLDEISHIKPIWLELGLQTSNKKTAEILNLQYDIDDLKDTLYRLEKTNIKSCIHILDGLPQETVEDMLQTIKDINHLPFHGIKIHMLHIISNTKLANMHKDNPFNLISRDQYIELVVKQLELLKPEIVVQRLTGDPIVEDLIEPLWLTNKTTILNDIDKLMRKLDTYQGSKYE